MFPMRMERQIEKFYAAWSPRVLAFCCLLLSEGSEAERTTVEAFQAYLSRGLDLDFVACPTFLFIFAMDAVKREGAPAARRCCASPVEGACGLRSSQRHAAGRHGHQRDCGGSRSGGSEDLDERVVPFARVAGQRLFLREKEMKVAIWKFIFRFVAGCSLLAVLASASRAQQATLTLEQALDMARTRAPVILSARARIEEARGRLKGASVLLEQNPSLEAEAGPRLSRPNNFTDMDVAVTQEFELGGRRKARIAGAEAGVARETANSGEATRRLLREVASSFSRALGAQERARLLATAETLAQEFLQIAERRYRAGDVAILEVNLSRTAVARARAERRVAAADLSIELGELRVLLGMKPGESIAIAGDLHERGAYDQTALLARSLEERPEFQALQAELREAEADVRLGDGFKWPDLGLGARYRRDTGDNIYQGGVKITLPVFSRGQELRATGNARASRIRLEMEALRNAVQHEIASSFEAYESRVEASGELEGGALPSLSENENLAKRSYQEGEIGIAELLLIRKETLDTRLAYVSSLLDAKLAEVELQFRAGVLR